MRATVTMGKKSQNQEMTYFTFWKTTTIPKYYMQQNYVEKLKENRLKAFMTTMSDLWKILKALE